MFLGLKERPSAQRDSYEIGQHGQQDGKMTDCLMDERQYGTTIARTGEFMD